MGEGAMPAQSATEPAALHEPGLEFLLPRIPDRFDEWLRAPLPYASSDPRFQAQRALLMDFVARQCLPVDSDAL